MIPINTDAIPEWFANALLSMGFHGIPGDGMEAIYIPWIDIAALAFTIAMLAFVITMLIQNDKELSS